MSVTGVYIFIIITASPALISCFMLDLASVNLDSASHLNRRSCQPLLVSSADSKLTFVKRFRKRTAYRDHGHCITA